MIDLSDIYPLLNKNGVVGVLSLFEVGLVGKQMSNRIDSCDGVERVGVVIWNKAVVFACAGTFLLQLPCL